MPQSQDAHPGFFEILACPRAYTTAAYLLLSLGTGIFAFTFVIVGVSMSLGLAIIILGIPVALAFLAGTRALALGELWLLRALVVDSPTGVPHWLPAGTGWLARLKTLCTDPHTWTSLLYFLLKLPLGVAGFTLMLVGSVLALVFLAVPIARLLHLGGTMNLEGFDMVVLGARPQVAMVLCALLGALFLPLTLHLGMALGRVQGWLARHLLLQA
jgi:hypothetical protein